MKRKFGVDDKCYDLAKHFLAEVKGVKPEDIQELAEELQRRCEDACRTVIEDEDSKAYFEGASGPTVTITDTEIFVDGVPLAAKARST